MMILPRLDTDRLSSQQQIERSSLCPSKEFLEFKKEEVEQSITDRFEKQVAKYFARTAVKTQRHQLTYDMLNQAANRLARLILAQRGTGQEPVALLLDNGPLAIVAVLGVLKAGKIFVTLDPLFPQARLRYMLADSQAGLIVSSTQHLPLASEMAGSGCQLINIDTIPSDVSSENLDLPLGPDAIAYIIYTSGSTGMPKGIVHTHRNVLHNIMNYTNAFHVFPADRLTLLHSLSFSSAMVDIFCALLNGATSYPWDVKQEGLANLANWLSEEAITIYNWAPTPFRHFVETLSDEVTFPMLRLLVLGSESVTKREVELYRQHFSSSCIFVNRLGTSETNNFRFYFIDHETPTNGDIIPAGYPVEGKEVILFDDAGRPVGFNQVGEIGVKSRYLAPGYWRKPELTQSVFLPDPSGGEELIYLTGDLGRLRPDGCLEYLGRKDFQVKIRGHRIETSEIEMALVASSSIKDAVVVARDDQFGDKHLVAYLVSAGQAEPSVSELRRHLNEQLTDYMVPSAFVFLKELPVTPTGKIDRQALPAPNVASSRLEDQFAAPRNPSEEILAEIWANLLGVQRVGIHDNFFELGGHSLAAASLFVKIEDHFGKKLPLATLFQAPTVAQLANLLTDEGWSPSWSSLVAIQPNGSKPPLFFVHAHGGNVIGYRDLARHLGPDQPFFGLQSQWLNECPIDNFRFEDMAAHYIEEIRIVQPRGPYFLGGWCFGGNLALEMAQQLRAQGEEVALVAMIQSTHKNYPEYLPGTTPLHRLVYRFMDRLDLEISNFLEVDTDRKWSYIIGRAKRGATIMHVKAEKIIGDFLARFLHISITHSQAYMLEELGKCNNKAYRNYEARPYQGGVTIFRAEKQRMGICHDPSLGWRPLIEGELVIRDLPGHHIGLLSEPRVQITAEQFRDVLKEAQQRYIQPNLQ